MPGMQGDELAREMLATRPDLPIILCTGFSETISPRQAAALGIREFVMKPIVTSHLAEAMRRALA
jgi:FixJ family two-component response regulator